MKKEPITIKGAGISGLTAAINLAKRGFPVTVFERNSEVGKRHHGDFQGLENWSDKEDTLDLLKKWNIEINFDFCPVYEIQLNFEGKTYHLKDKRPFVYLVKRGGEGSLDFTLKKQAIKNGVEIKFGTTVEKPTDIISTGPKKSVGAVYGGLFKTSVAEPKIILLIDQNLAPNSYAYAFLWKNEGPIGTVLFKGDYKNWKIRWKNTRSKIEGLCDFEFKKIKGFSGFGDFSIPKTATVDGSLITGEAAGFQDFLFFGGIKYAFQSGFLAAKAISENRDYDQLWKEAFLPKMKASVVNRWGFSNRILRNLVARYGLERGSKEGYLNLGYKFYNFSIWHRLAYPYARLKYRHLL